MFGSRRSSRAEPEPGLVGVAADHGHRHLVELAHDELGGRGQLVGDGEDRRLERVAVGVRHAEIGLEGAEPGDADRHVDETLPPGPAEGVGDDHRDVDALLGPDAVREGPRRGVGVLWQEARPARPTFDWSTPALAQIWPWCVSVMRMPRSMRTTRRDSRRMTSISRGSFF